MARSVFVYVIDQEDGGAVKIGVTADLTKRLKGVQTGNPRRLAIHFSALFEDEKTARIIERRAHMVLRKHRLSGEWFSCDARSAKAAIVMAATGKVFALGRSNPFYRLPTMLDEAV